MTHDLVLVGYRLNHVREAIMFCNTHFPRAQGARRILVLNDPELEAPLTYASKEGWEILRGTNVLGEFSGWQEGLDALRGSRNSAIFANDTVTTHRIFTGARLCALKLAMRKAAGASFVGFRDRDEGKLSVAGLPLDSWVRTDFFVLTREALARLEYRLYDPDLASACVPGGSEESNFFRNLSPDLTTRLLKHLFGGFWYASERLTQANAARMTFKAKCIVSEKLLSARCQALDIAAVDPFRLYRWAFRLDDLALRGPAGISAGVMRLTARTARRILHIG